MVRGAGRRRDRLAAARRRSGFGYDPIFVAAGMTATFGEMDPAEKHAISHRADAFRKLVAACCERTQDPPRWARAILPSLAAEEAAWVGFDADAFAAR